MGEQRRDERMRMFAKLASFAVAYAFLRQLSGSLAIGPDHLQPLNLTEGFVLGFLLITPRKQWPAMLLLQGVVHAAFTWSAGTVFCVAGTLAAMLSPTCTASLLQHCDKEDNLSLKWLGKLSAAALIPVAAASTVEIGLAANPSTAAFAVAAIGRLISIAIMVPAISQTRSRLPFPRHKALVELGVTATVVLLPTALAFQLTRPVVPFLVLIPMFYAAQRFELRLSSILLFAFCLLSTHQTLQVSGDATMVFSLQAYLAVVAAGTACLGVVREGHRSELRDTQQSEQLFRHTFEQAAVGIVHMGLNGRLLRVNRWFCEIINRSEEEVIGRCLSELSDQGVLSNDIERLRTDDARRLQQEMCFRNNDGEAVWAQLTLSLVTSGGGRPSYFLGVVEDITEKKQAEDELSRAKEQAELLHRVAPTAIFTVDCQKQITSWNDEAERLTGYAASEVLGKKCNQFTSNALAECAGLFETSDFVPSKNKECVLKRKDGEVRIIEKNTEVLRDSKGEMTGTIESFSDITEARRAQKERRETVEFLSTLLDTIPSPVFFKDTNGVFQGCNEVFASHIMGLQREQIIGSTLFDLPKNITESFKDEFSDQDQDLLRKGGVRVHEATVKCADGEARDFHVSKATFANAGGETAGIVGVMINITARKRAEAEVRELNEELETRVVERTEKLQTAMNALKEGENRYRSLFESSSDAIFIMWGEMLIDCNRMALAMFDCTRRQLVGHGLHEFSPKQQLDGTNSRDRLMARIHNAAYGDPQFFEWRHSTRDGTPFDADVSLIPLELGEKQYIQAIVRDVTKRKKSEQDLIKARDLAENANRTKSEFLANMSHEIRTPLNAVIGFSQLLSSLVADDVQRNYVNSIKTAGRSLLTLINDILDLSKLEAGMMQLQCEPVMLKSIMHEIGQIFQTKANDQGLIFKIELDEDLPRVLMMDEIRVRQMLLNLVGNAVKFTEEGTVRISARLARPISEDETVDVAIQVEDTGIGIPEAEIREIFESFRQQSRQDARRYGGTGLGLSITKKLVQMMNGQIDVRSKAGVGSTFTVKLRDVQVSRESVPETDGGDFDYGRVRFDSAKVLVADDVPSNRNLIRDCLTAVNLQVIEAGDGIEAVREARAQNPDLIVMDLRMPEMDGVDAATELKKDALTADIPIIALTASVDEASRRRVTQSSFDGFIAKPVQLSSLVDILAAFLPHDVNFPIAETRQREEEIMQVLDDVQRNAALREAIVEHIFPKTQELGSGVKFSSVKDLGEELAAVGEQFHSRYFESTGNSLINQAVCFDIKSIGETLRELNEIKDAIRCPEGIRHE